MGEVLGRSFPIPQEPNLEDVVYAGAPNVSPEEEEEDSVSRAGSFSSLRRNSESEVEIDHLGESHAVSTNLIDKLKVECKKISTAVKSFFANLQEDRNEFFYRNTKADQESKHFKSLQDVFVKMDQEFLDDASSDPRAVVESSDRRAVVASLTSARLGLERREKKGAKGPYFDAVKARFQKIANKAVPYTLSDDHYKLAQSLYHARSKKEVSAILGLGKIDPVKQKEAADKVIMVLDEMEARVLANPTLADNLKYRMKYLAQIQGIKLTLQGYAPEIYKMVKESRKDSGEPFERRYRLQSINSYLVSSYEWAKAHQKEDPKRCNEILENNRELLKKLLAKFKEEARLSPDSSIALLGKLYEQLLADIPPSEESLAAEAPGEEEAKGDEPEVAAQPLQPPSPELEPAQPRRPSSVDVLPKEQEHKGKAAEELKEREAIRGVEFEERARSGVARSTALNNLVQRLGIKHKVNKFADLPIQELLDLTKDTLAILKRRGEIDKLTISALKMIRTNDFGNHYYIQIQTLLSEIDKQIDLIEKRSQEADQDEIEVDE